MAPRKDRPPRGVNLMELVIVAAMVGLLVVIVVKLAAR